VLHLLYSRFVTKVLYDAGHIGFSEPFASLFTQGMICKMSAVCTRCGKVVTEDESVAAKCRCDVEASAENRIENDIEVTQRLEKMSKSKGNVVAPDDLIEKFGADTQRLYTLFIGPPEKDAEWNDAAVAGCFRFLNRLWEIVWDNSERLTDVTAAENGDGLSSTGRDLRRKTHQTIRKVTSDVEGEFHFNTAVSAVMELVNQVRDALEADPPVEDAALKEALEGTLLMLAPFVPHITEELWQALGNEPSIFEQRWPDFDREAAREEEVEIVIQINGKVRSKAVISADASEEAMQETAMVDERISELMEGKTVRKVITVPKKLVNIVVG
jgi:leucyl-tRNA synthetase